MAGEFVAALLPRGPIGTFEFIALGVVVLAVGSAYEFADFVRVGGPLQLLSAVVTTVGIAALWGL